MAYALIPSLLGIDWWDAYDYPTRIMDQFFGDALLDSDLLPPSVYRGFVVRPRTQASINASGKSEVSNDNKDFKVSLNVSQFKPEELEVKVVDNFLLVHAKHEEKSDEHGFIAREFTRKYMLPKNCEMEKVTSTLTPEGILMIQAPKMVPLETPKEERNIPISQETPAAVEDK